MIFLELTSKYCKEKKGMKDTVNDTEQILWT